MPLLSWPLPPPSPAPSSHSSSLIHSVCPSCTRSINTLSRSTPAVRALKCHRQLGIAVKFISSAVKRGGGREPLTPTKMVCGRGSTLVVRLIRVGIKRSQQQPQRSVCRDLSCRSRHVRLHRGNLAAPETTTGTHKHRGKSDISCWNIQSVLSHLLCIIYKLKNVPQNFLSALP